VAWSLLPWEEILRRPGPPSAGSGDNWADTSPARALILPRGPPGSYAEASAHPFGTKIFNSRTSRDACPDRGFTWLRDSPDPAIEQVPGSMRVDDRQVHDPGRPDLERRDSRGMAGHAWEPEGYEPTKTIPATASGMGEIGCVRPPGQVNAKSSTPSARWGSRGFDHPTLAPARVATGWTWRAASRVRAPPERLPAPATSVRSQGRRTRRRRRGSDFGTAPVQAARSSSCGVTCMAGGGRPPGGDGAAVAARISSVPDRRAAGVPPGHGAPLEGRFSYLLMPSQGLLV
jgi:hypothetical protein